MKISGFNKELRMRNIYSIYLHQQSLTIKLFQKRVCESIGWALLVYYVIFCTSSCEWHFCWSKQRLISAIIYIYQDIAINLFRKGSANPWDERYLFIYLGCSLATLNLFKSTHAYI